MHAVESLSSGWRKKRIPFGVDNQAFQKSAGKGWSRAERLNLLLKRLFVIQMKCDCLLVFYWLATDENVLADHLSRGRIDDFVKAASYSCLFAQDAVLTPMPGIGSKRNLDMSAPLGPADMASIASSARERVDMHVRSAQVRAVVVLQAAARGLLARVAVSRVVAASCAATVPIPVTDTVTESSDTRACNVGVPVFEVSGDARGMHAPLPVDGVPDVSRRVHARGRGAGGVHRWALLLVAGLGLAQAAPGESYSAQMSSVPYSRATLYAGLPAALLSQLDAVMDNRLAESSMQTINAALKHWAVVADYWSWPLVIQADDPHRGGKLVAFVLYMVHETELRSESISGYVLGMRKWQVLQRQSDPVFGLMNFHDFMVGVKVLANDGPGEPRRALPLALITAMASAVDLDVFWEVQFMFFLVLLLFTFSRSECPCPKSFTGNNSWDGMKHWMVRDIVIKLVSGVWVLGVRFKAIKQDPRIERPEARSTGAEPGESKKGGSDWSYVGDAPRSKLSPFKWYRMLMDFYEGPRAEDEPFFMAKDRVRPYTYTCAGKDLREMLSRVTDDLNFGLHGIRVEGYNAAKDAMGSEIAAAHGLWQPESHGRYARFNLVRDIFPLAAAMVAVDAPPRGRCDGRDVEEVDDVPVARSIDRGPQQRGDVSRPASEPPVVVTVAPAHQAVAQRIAARMAGSPFSPARTRSSARAD